MTERVVEMTEKEPCRFYEQTIMIIYKRECFMPEAFGPNQ